MSGYSPHRKSPLKKIPSRKWPQLWAATDGGSFPNLAWWEGIWPADSQVADSYPDAHYINVGFNKLLCTLLSSRKVK